MPKVKVRYAAAKPPAPVLIEGRGYRYSQVESTLTFYVECFKAKSKRPECGCAFKIELPAKHDSSKFSHEHAAKVVEEIETTPADKNPLVKLAPETITVFKFTRFKGITREDYESKYNVHALPPDDDEEEIAVKFIKGKDGKPVLGLANEGGAK